VVTLLGVAVRALEPVRSHDPALAGLADRLSEASYLISDVAGELASYTESLDSDPARLAAVQERRAALGRLIRAYAAASGDLVGVLDWAKQAGSRLAELEGDDDKIAALAAEEAALQSEVTSLAARLTGLRSAAAERFAAEVTAELTGWPCRTRRSPPWSATWTRPAPTVPTTWRSGWPRTRARRRCR
jgi:ATPase involved in DNA repair